MLHQRFETFTALINNISRSIRRIKTEEIEAFELKGSHVSVLYYLYSENKLTAKDLCDRCETDKANISRILEYLEKEDYIVCESTGTKRYRSYFSLTEKGNTIGDYISEKVNTVLYMSNAGISEDELKTMYKCLSVISENLKNINLSSEENQ